MAFENLALFSRQSIAVPISQAEKPMRGKVIARIDHKSSVSHAEFVRGQGVARKSKAKKTEPNTRFFFQAMALHQHANHTAIAIAAQISKTIAVRTLLFSVNRSSIAMINIKNNPGKKGMRA